MSEFLETHEIIVLDCSPSFTTYLNSYENFSHKELIDEIYNVLSDYKQVEKFNFDYIIGSISSNIIENNEMIFKNLLAVYFNSLIEMKCEPISRKLDEMLKYARNNFVVKLAKYLGIDENFSSYLFQIPYIDSEQMLQLNIKFRKPS